MNLEIRKWRASSDHTSFFLLFFLNFLLFILTFYGFLVSKQENVRKKPEKLFSEKKNYSDQEEGQRESERERERGLSFERWGGGGRSTRASSYWGRYACSDGRGCGS